MNFEYKTKDPYTLLKPKRHSLRCHDFMVHALPLRMCTNVVDFRVMRRLCRREWNWQWNWRCMNHIHGIYDNGPHDHGVWRLTLTVYSLETLFIGNIEISDISGCLHRNRELIVAHDGLKVACKLVWDAGEDVVSYELKIKLNSLSVIWNL